MQTVIDDSDILVLSETTLVEHGATVGMTHLAGRAC